VLLKFLAVYSLTSLAWGQTVLQEGKRALEAGQYAEAARFFEAAHKQSPSCEILFLLGLAQYRMKQVDSALISLQSSVQCDPNLTSAYIAIGQAYAGKDNSNEALAAYAQALKVHPKDKDALRGAATLYLRANQLAKAIELLESLTTLDPTAPRSHVDLGAAYFGMGNQDGAEAQFQAALRLEPNDADAMLGLATIRLRNGEDDRTIGVLRRLTTLVPNAYEPHYLFGVVYNRQSRYVQAVTELQTALRLGGNKAETYYQLAQAYGGLGRVDARRAALTTFAELNSKSNADAELTLLVEEAKSSINFGDLNMAVSRLEKAHELSPSNATILFSLGSVCYDLRLYERARDYAQQAIKVAPSQWRYHYLLGAIEIASKHWREAQKSLETAIELGPSSAELQNALGQVALAQGDSKRAVERFQRAVELDPKQQAYSENLSAARRAAGR
jgi:Flp pilus assembly protein TadD